MLILLPGNLLQKCKLTALTWSWDTDLDSGNQFCGNKKTPDPAQFEAICMHPANLRVTDVFWLRKASTELPRSVDGMEHLHDRCLWCLMQLEQNMCPFHVARDRFMHFLSDDVWKQGKKVWPLLICPYFWFYSSKLLITFKGCWLQNTASVIPLNFRKHAGRKQRLLNIFNLSGIIHIPGSKASTDVAVAWEDRCFHNQIPLLLAISHILLLSVTPHSMEYPFG